MIPVAYRLAPVLQALAVVVLARAPGARQALPVLGLFTGPLGAVLIALGLLAAARRTVPRWPALPLPRAWLLFVLSAVLSCAVAVHYAREVEPSGDEIDYLLMAQSVWREGDLDLRDNFARGDFLEYLGGLDRMPGGVHGVDDRYHPAHSGGYAVLLAPAYAIGGRLGCVVLQGLLAAGLALLVFDIARRSAEPGSAALFAWAAAAGPPVLFYAGFLYTELAIAFAIALALRLVLWSRHVAASVLAALVLSTLPWLHVRMALAAAVIGGFAVFRFRDRARVAFLATVGLTAAYFVYEQLAAFGTLSPTARYGGLPPGMENPTPARTFFGLFVDGAYGLLPYAPVYVLALAGLPLLLRRRATTTAHPPAPSRIATAGRVLACAGTSALLPVLAWRNWFGFSPPARFTIPLIPVLAVAAALRVSADPDRGLARWRWPLVALGLAFALFLFFDPPMMRMVNGRYGTSHSYDALAGTVSLSRYLPFPSSRTGTPTPPWGPPASEARVAFVWVSAVVALVALDVLARRHERVDRWFSGLSLPLALLLAISLAVDHWARPSPRLAAPPTASTRAAAPVT